MSIIEVGLESELLKAAKHIYLEVRIFLHELLCFIAIIRALFVHL